MIACSRTSCHVSNHCKLLSWTWQWVQGTQRALTVTRSQSKHSVVGMWSKATLASWICSWTKTSGVFPAPWWIFAGSSEGTRGFNPVLLQHHLTLWHCTRIICNQSIQSSQLCDTAVASISKLYDLSERRKWGCRQMWPGDRNRTPQYSSSRSEAWILI